MAGILCTALVQITETSCAVKLFMFSAKSEKRTFLISSFGCYFPVHGVVNGQKVLPLQAIRSKLTEKNIYRTELGMEAIQLLWYANSLLKPFEGLQQF